MSFNRLQKTRINAFQVEVIHEDDLTTGTRVWVARILDKVIAKSRKRETLMRRLDDKGYVSHRRSMVREAK